MEMTKFEKKFVNRRQKAEANFKNLCAGLKKIDTSSIKNVLELGCGIGIASALLSEKFQFDVYGTDYDKQQIALAKEMNRENELLHFQFEDAANLTFDTSCFDMVVSQHVFHHIPNWKSAIYEVARVLRPGGYFIWADFACSRTLQFLFQGIFKNYGVYGIAEIREEFSEGGFEELSFQKGFPLPFGRYEIIMQKQE
jgi:ubiquinone/menaquinone biosynthesis C-methylase UbiE